MSIGYGQTISQPYIVGVMTQLLNLHGVEVVLEVGTRYLIMSNPQAHK